jgi:uncharacterized membrane protein
MAKVQTHEKIVILCPSALFCACFIVQLFVIGHFFDQNYNNNKPNASFFHRWYGVWVIMPMHAFFIVVWISIGMMTMRHNRRLQEKEKQSRMSDMVSEDEDDTVYFNNPPPNPIPINGITAEQDVDVDEAQIEFNAIQLANQLASDMSILQKVAFLWPGFIVTSIKISWDTNHEYSWMLVFLPWILYFGYFLGIAVTHRNWLWQSQIDIDREEKVLSVNI